MSKALLKKSLQNIIGKFPFSDTLLKEIEIFKIPKNRVIYIPGDSASSLFLLLKGMISVSRVTPNGRGIILDYINNNQFFGDEILLGGNNGRWELAEAKEESVIAAINISTLKSYFFQEQKILTVLLTDALTKRQRFADRMEILLHREVRVRLAALLLDLSYEYGKDTKEGTLIDINIPHHELARFIGATRETVSATISTFKSKGLIGSKGRKLVVLKPNLLESYL